MKEDRDPHLGFHPTKGLQHVGAPAFHIEQAVTHVLGLLANGTHREILSQRLGLFGDKETLAQLSRSFLISKTSVHNIEHTCLGQLGLLTAQGTQECDVSEITQWLLEGVQSMGGAARMSDFAVRLGLADTALQLRQLTFLATVCPSLHLIRDNNIIFEAVSLYDPVTTATIVERIVSAVEYLGEPVTIKQVAEKVHDRDVRAVAAFASLSRRLATMDGRWGLTSWPVVNPVSISDKISLVLHRQGRPMHFAEIAKQVQSMRSSKRIVSWRSVHNELVRSSGFVVVARGTYGLRAWGYRDGSISDLISDVLREAGRPLPNIEIVLRVLERRPYVKKISIQSKLCSQPQFERVAPGFYQLNEQVARSVAVPSGRRRLMRREAV